MAYSTLKGTVTNTFAYFESLRPAWFHGEYFAHEVEIWEKIPRVMSPHDETQFAPVRLHLYYSTPTPELIQHAVKIPNYCHEWMTLNEPDLDFEKMSPSDALKLVTEQMQVVKSVDASAKFWLGAGSQVHAPFYHNGDGWVCELWANLPRWARNMTVGFHTHYYVQSQWLDDLDRVFSPQPIVNYLDQWFTWIAQNSNRPRGLMLSEIGLAMRDSILDDRRLCLYPAIVEKACARRGVPWAWYSISKRDGYLILADDMKREVTCTGRVFGAL